MSGHCCNLSPLGHLVYLFLSSHSAHFTLYIYLPIFIFFYRVSMCAFFLISLLLPEVGPEYLLLFPFMYNMFWNDNKTSLSFHACGHFCPICKYTDIYALKVKITTENQGSVSCCHASSLVLLQSNQLRACASKTSTDQASWLLVDPPAQIHWDKIIQSYGSFRLSKWYWYEWMKLW